METALVSIVLPIYNVEKYLERCIESVTQQTYSNLEILLVDDGSMDNCPEICDKWALKDSRIRVIHKQNQGLGMARNTGIKYATGEYICFFDSDDYIREDMVEKTVNQMLRHQADLAVFGFSSINSAGEIVATFVPNSKENYQGEEVWNDFLPNFIAPSYTIKEPRAFYMSAWVAMYSMDVIRRSGWRFVSEREIMSEDVYSLINLIQYVKRVTVLPEAFYYYQINEKSLSRKYEPDRYQRIRYFYQETIKLCNEIGYNADVLHRVSKPYLAFTLAAMKQEAMAPLSFKERFCHIKEIICDEMLQKVLRQNRKDVVSITRRMIFYFMRHKCYLITFGFVWGKQ